MSADEQRKFAAFYKIEQTGTGKINQGIIEVTASSWADVFNCLMTRNAEFFQCDKSDLHVISFNSLG